MILDIFSKRKRNRERGGRVDMFVYDRLAPEFLIQVQHIWATAVGNGDFSDSFAYRHRRPRANEFWIELDRALAREYGRHTLGTPRSDPEARCVNHLMNAGLDEALDIIEASFRMIDKVARADFYDRRSSGEVTQAPDDAIAELNARFREHSIGYQFMGGEIVRVDSEFVHAEVVVPALALLRDEDFEGAEDEFRTAHDHYRHGRIEACLNDALKAFESTMKTICERRSWAFDQKDTAKQLIKIMFEKELLPEFLTNHFSGVRGALESGVPTIRNRMGGHGQGSKEREVPAHFAAHILHLTAANILLLGEAHRTLPK